MHENLTIIVPCYNEALSLPLIVSAFNEIKDKNKFQLVLLDNGSTDGSAKFLASVKSSNINIVTVPINKGYGNGLVKAIRNVNTPFTGWIHADQINLLNEINTWDIENLRGNIFVKGVRKHRPLSQRFFSVGMSLCCSIILRVRLREINAQPSIYPTNFLWSLKNPPGDFSVDLFYYSNAKIRGLHETRIKTDFFDRTIGTSNWKTGLASILQMSAITLRAGWRMRANND